ncbi:uncharacterized protein LY89DRAFT_28634 [Mollisia scopiformis]|uniref:Uncharacterized protein n=1 Tax=Mollisia scopiformis TaxID=149040 RepID=A0A194XCF6_MOLSC|nr:uncharacterized protein LY89DRAFT_28634 [Mollisia scopiformis]KUJ17858.1 hypothetical protein LY89DRAFT_28634 [Mollisia scopiformis]
MIEDFDKTWHMAEILRTVHRRVIEAIIDGTIGYRYHTDPEFGKLFPPEDDLAGIYLNTLVCERDGKGLSTNDWERLQKLMTEYVDGLRERGEHADTCSYMDGEGHKIGPNSSTQQRQAAVDAAKIYYKFCKKRNETWQKILADANNGIRPLVQKSGGRQFCEMMSNRIRKDLDPSGDIRQLQMPVQIGCSESLKKRMSDYSPKSRMTSTPDTWRLTVSCLEFLSIKMVHIGVPIVKVWEQEMLPLGEIFFTLISGSMIQWGGFNPVAGGARRGFDEGRDTSDEKKQAIIDQPWASENLDHSTTVISRRVKALQSAADLLESDEVDTNMERRLEDGKAILHRRTSLEKRAEQAVDEVNAATKALQDHNSRLADEVTRKQVYLNFGNDIASWLGGSVMKPVDEANSDVNGSGPES